MELESLDKDGLGAPLLAKKLGHINPVGCDGAPRMSASPPLAHPGVRVLWRFSSRAEQVDVCKIFAYNMTIDISGFPVFEFEDFSIFVIRIHSLFQ